MCTPRHALFLLIVRWAWGVLCAFMLALWGHELWTVLNHPEAYAHLWSAEGPVAGVWYYASKERYLIHLGVLMLWFFVGIWLGFAEHPGRPWRRSLMFGHVALTLLWAMTVIFDGGLWG